MFVAIKIRKSNPVLRYLISHDGERDRLCMCGGRKKAKERLRSRSTDVSSSSSAVVQVCIRSVALLWPSVVSCVRRKRKEKHRRGHIRQSRLYMQENTKYVKYCEPIVWMYN